MTLQVSYDFQLIHPIKAHGSVHVLFKSQTSVNMTTEDADRIIALSIENSESTNLHGKFNHEAREIATAVGVKRLQSIHLINLTRILEVYGGKKSLIKEMHDSISKVIEDKDNAKGITMALDCINKKQRRSQTIEYIMDHFSKREIAMALMELAWLNQEEAEHMTDQLQEAKLKRHCGSSVVNFMREIPGIDSEDVPIVVFEIHTDEDCKYEH